MARLVKAGTNTKGGFNYQVVLDSYEDIKVLIKLYKELEKEGLIPRNNILKDEEDKINVDDLMNAVDRLNKVPDYNDLLKENQELKKRLEEYKDKINWYENFDLQQRIDKAIEYINENWGHWCSNHCKYATETINILKGSDKE